MSIRVTARSTVRLIGAVSVLISALPAHAERAPQARLVHCGQNTCLRLSGHRSGNTIAIRVAGQQLAVAGDHNWIAMVPLRAARAWEQSSGGVLTLTYVNSQGGVEIEKHVVLPPGAIGRHVELASLVIRAR